MPIDGPALGATGRYSSTSKPTVGMLVSVRTLVYPDQVQDHEYRVVEIIDSRVTNRSTELHSRFVRSLPPEPAPPPDPNPVSGGPGFMSNLP